MAHRPWNPQVSSSSEGSPCMAQQKMNLPASANRLQGPPIFTPAHDTEQFDSEDPGLCPPTTGSWVWASPVSLLTALWPFQPGVTQALGQFEFIHQLLAQNWEDDWQAASVCTFGFIIFLNGGSCHVHQWSSQKNKELLQLTCSRAHFPNLASFKWLQFPQRTQWKQYFPTAMNRLQHFSELQIILLLVNDFHCCRNRPNTSNSALDFVLKNPLHVRCSPWYCT